MRRPLVGIYPGTFDPITNGHVDLINRATRVLDKLIVAVSVNPDKHTLFSPEERVDLIRRSIGERPEVEVVAITGLTATYASQIGASVIVRGLRAVSDFEFEFSMAIMNRRLNPDAETLYLMPSRRYVYLSSSVVKDVARHGGRIAGLVPDPVLEALRAKFEAERE